MLSECISASINRLQILLGLLQVRSCKDSDHILLLLNRSYVLQRTGSSRDIVNGVMLEVRIRLSAGCQFSVSQHNECRDVCQR